MIGRLSPQVSTHAFAFWLLNSLAATIIVQRGINNKPVAKRAKANYDWMEIWKYGNKAGVSISNQLTIWLDKDILKQKQTRANKDPF